MTGPLIREGYAKNGSVRLHYTESSPDTPSRLTPLVYIHGAYGGTEGFLPEMEALAPRRCISVRLRGRAKAASQNRDTHSTTTCQILKPLLIICA